MENPEFPAVSYADWLRKVGSALEDRVEGVDLNALCTADHPERSLIAIPERPGLGIRVPDDLDLGWIPCQTFDHGGPEKLNHHLRSDLRDGAAGVRLRLDRAGRSGEDPMISAGTGVDGVALYSSLDLAEAFEGTPEDWRLLLLDAGGSFLPSAAHLIHWLRDTGQDSRARTLLLGADPLAALARDGVLPAPLPAVAADMAELVSYGNSSGDLDVRALAVSAEPYREAGAEIDQELAVALASGVELLRALESSGVEPEAVAAQLAFLTCTGQQIFLEVAKLRALRILWDQILRACRIESPKQPWIHASVLRRSLPDREPSINLLRATNATFASILGGADSVETPAYDWASSDGGSDRGRRLARNTQFILGLEAQVGRVLDPGKGAYLLESVTDDLLEKGWALFQQIEEQGGLVATLASGWLQDSIDRRWGLRQEALERGEIPLTGVNIYVDSDSGPPPTPETDLSGVQEGIRRRVAKQSGESSHEVAFEPPRPGRRWDWCQKAASRQLSVFSMSSILYEGDEGPAVRALTPRSDSDPVPPNWETS